MSEEFHTNFDEQMKINLDPIVSGHLKFMQRVNLGEFLILVAQNFVISRLPLNVTKHLIYKDRLDKKEHAYIVRIKRR
jgi:hypothetical protein